MIWLIRNWRLVAGGLLLLAVAYLVHYVDSSIYENRLTAAIAEQKRLDVEACTAAQAITKETNDALQKSRDAIARKLAALKLQQPVRCVPVARNPQLPGSGGEYAGQNGSGLSSDWLREYAAEAEGYRSQVIQCIDFLQKERQR